MKITLSTYKKPVVASKEQDNTDYDIFLRAIRENFGKKIINNSLFETDANGLFNTFVNSLPKEMKQEHMCRNCKAFFDAYGGLVAIDDNGQAISALWSDSADVPANYKIAVQRLNSIVRHAAVTGVFLPTSTVLGKTRTGDWKHLSVAVPHRKFFNYSPKIKNKVMSYVRIGYLTLKSSLGMFSTEDAKTLMSLINNHAIFRSDRIRKQAKWFLDLKINLSFITDKNRLNNLLWKYAYESPPGFCHIKNSVIGTILEDIHNGIPLAKIINRFDKKMDPTKYMRAVAPPKAGNAIQADNLFVQLKAAESLGRRFAKLSDLQLLWKYDGGRNPILHRHKGLISKTLFPNPKNVGNRQTVNITWKRFEKEVLPNVVSLRMLMNREMNFSAFTTARNKNAPILFQWDNPVCWYMYTTRRNPLQWNLKMGDFITVDGITESPPMWNRDYDGDLKGVFFILADCYDKSYGSDIDPNEVKLGTMIFPETLKSVFHPVKRSIESFSQKDTLGRPYGAACGVFLQDKHHSSLIVEITDVAGMSYRYLIDRYE